MVDAKRQEETKSDACPNCDNGVLNVVRYSLIAVFFRQLICGVCGFTLWEEMKGHRRENTAHRQSNYLQGRGAMVSELLISGEITQAKAHRIVDELDRAPGSSTAKMWWLRGFIAGAGKRICPETADFFVDYMGSSM